MPLIIFWFDAPHVGLALATSMSAWLQAWMLNRKLRKAGVYQPTVGWWWFGLRVLLAVTAMSILLWVLLAPQPQWLAWNAWTRVWQLLLLVVAGAVGYLVALLVQGIRPWRL